MLYIIKACLDSTILKYEFHARMIAHKQQNMKFLWAKKKSSSHAHARTQTHIHPGRRNLLLKYQELLYLCGPLEGGCWMVECSHNFKASKIIKLSCTHERPYRFWIMENTATFLYMVNLQNLWSYHNLILKMCKKNMPFDEYDHYNDQNKRKKWHQ